MFPELSPQKRRGVAFALKFVWKMLHISLKDFPIDISTLKALTSPAEKKAV